VSQPAVKSAVSESNPFLFAVEIPGSAPIETPTPNDPIPENSPSPEVPSPGTAPSPPNPIPPFDTQVQEAPLAHQGSGGPGDDRQDNSPGSSTDPSAGDAVESEDPGANKSESDPE
jgi:hypothetical protein